MKLNKVILTITIEATHADTLPGLLTDVAQQITDEKISGNFAFSDGDSASWTIDQSEHTI